MVPPAAATAATVAFAIPGAFATAVGVVGGGGDCGGAHVGVGAVVGAAAPATTAPVADVHVVAVGGMYQAAALPPAKLMLCEDEGVQLRGQHPHSLG